mmetsp:Transcript_129894/g.376100  ORF Transcript_129894/g.376100 Transcript_129894/m.376100 type:complete len:203 (+) Transcript_129894:905-1513(+)
MRRVSQWKSAAHASATAGSSDAMTAPLGYASTNSFAKVGPLKKAIGCLRCKARGTSSAMVSNVSLCKPFDVEMIGTFSAMRSFIPPKKPSEDCTGIQCTMNAAPAKASFALVVADNRAGNFTPVRCIGFTCSTLMLRATSSRRVSMHTENPLRAISVLIAVPKVPEPRTQTFAPFRGISTTMAESHKRPAAQAGLLTDASDT